MAHIGWAHYLRFRENRVHDARDVTAFFDQALQHDPHNVWAHGMLGFWQLYRGDALAPALEHFSQATVPGEHQQELLELSLSALLQQHHADAEAAALATAYRLSQRPAYIWQPGTARTILRLYTSAVLDETAFESLTHGMAVEQHLQLLQSLKQPASGSSELARLRLYRRGGEQNQARTLIEAMQNHQPPYAPAIQQALSAMREAGG